MRWKQMPSCTFLLQEENNVLSFKLSKVRFVLHCLILFLLSEKFEDDQFKHFNNLKAFKKLNLRKMCTMP